MNRSTTSTGALDAYQTNIDLDATFYDSRIHLGILLYRLTRYDEAVQHLTQASRAETQ